MSARAVFEREAQAAIDALKADAGSLVARASTEDREVIEETLKRAAVLQSFLLMDQDNTVASEELASALNTLAFVRVKYQLEAAAVLRKFLDDVLARVTDVALKAAFAALGA